MFREGVYFVLGVAISAGIIGLAILITSTAFILWSWYGLAIVFLLLIGLGLTSSLWQGTGSPRRTPVGFSGSRDAYAEMAGRQASQHVPMAGDVRTDAVESTLERLWMVAPLFISALALLLIYYT